MPAAVIGVVAMPFGWDDIVWRIMGLGVEGMLRISAVVASWPGAGGAFRGFGVPVLLLLSLAILCATLWRSALRWIAVPLAALAVSLAAREHPADILVTADGQAVLVRGPDGRLGVVGRRPSSFTLEQWLRADGDTRPVEDRSLFAGGRCDPDGCVATLAAGGAVAQVLRPEAFEEDCRRAVVLVTPLRAPAFCRPPVLLDRERLAGTGAVALVPRGPRPVGGTLAVDPPFELVSQRQPTTDRPWIRKPRTAAPTAPSTGAPSSRPREPDRATREDAGSTEKTAPGKTPAWSKAGAVVPPPHDRSQPDRGRGVAGARDDVDTLDAEDPPQTWTEPLR